MSLERVGQAGEDMRGRGPFEAGVPRGWGGREVRGAASAAFCILTPGTCVALASGSAYKEFSLSLQKTRGFLSQGYLEQLLW